MNEHKKAAIATIRDVATAYNLAYPGDQITTDDFAESSVVTPPVDLSTQLRDDGCMFLRDYQAVIDESAASDNPAYQEWAKQATPWGQLPEVAQRKDVTEDQRADILQNCGRVSGLVGNRQTGWSDDRYAAQSFWPYRHDPITRQPIEAIKDAHAFMEAKPRSGFPGAKLSRVRFYAETHRDVWVASQSGVKR